MYTCVADNVSQCVCMIDNKITQYIIKYKSYIIFTCMCDNIDTDYWYYNKISSKYIHITITDTSDQIIGHYFLI